MTSRRQISLVAILGAVLIALVLGARTMLRSELAPVGVGVEAPDFSVATIDTIPKTKTLDDYRGQVVLINLWATWCGPCRVEMPAIESLHRAYASKGLKVIAISTDDPGTDAQIRDFVKQYGLTFEVLHDTGGQEGKVSKDYQTTGYPETVIIGRDGIIRKKLLGAHNWNSPENRALIERLLAEKS
ncbi:MAG TPA: TlpA disulfide reductase family protein [Gemmatimonadaceae bacterium]|jgi:peroxiredoxin|nr:TlpA disulfide reductase family protein [Gemmatimonadaceae bacterium]